MSEQRNKNFVYEFINKMENRTGITEDNFKDADRSPGGIFAKIGSEKNIGKKYEMVSQWYIGNKNNKDIAGEIIDMFKALHFVKIALQRLNLLGSKHFTGLVDEVMVKAKQKLK